MSKQFIKHEIKAIKMYIYFGHYIIQQHFSNKIYQTHVLNFSNSQQP